ncbi:MAG: ABC transporter ATP-binding protein [Actinomycetaceae bacterium]|nr:ABC transporter ATP-binding protein [Actinomycetaceae bacterium]
MLSISDYSKRYRHGGVGPLNFHVNTGEVVGIIGPNGAGKTTFFECLVGIKHPDNGNIILEGISNGKRLEAKNVGYVGEESLFPLRFTPRQALEYDAVLRGIPSHYGACSAALDLLQLMPKENIPLKHLSQGWRKRVDIASAFIGMPEVIILDEPLNSLDIAGVMLMRSVIKKAQTAGSIVMISSHILDFLDDVTSRIIFLSDGHIVADTHNSSESAENIYRGLFMEESDVK